MNYEEQKKPVEEAEVELALKRFRASILGWTEREFSNAQSLGRPFDAADWAEKRPRWSGLWRAMATPAMVWTMACALVMVSVGVPVTVHHERQIAAERQAAEVQRQRAAQEAAREAAAAANSIDTANSIDDGALMSGVDSDIAQATPDAMQPLASLMTDTSGGDLDTK